MTFPENSSFAPFCHMVMCMSLLLTVFSRVFLFFASFFFVKVAHRLNEDCKYVAAAHNPEHMAGLSAAITKNGLHPFMGCHAL